MFRLAVGATPGDVVRHFFSQGMSIEGLFLDCLTGIAGMVILAKPS